MRKITSGVLVAMAVASLMFATAAVAEEELSFTDVTPISYSMAPEAEFGCGSQCCDPCCAAPRWTVRAGAVTLHRSREGNVDVLVDAGNGNATIYNISEADLGWATGPSLSAILHTDGVFDVQLDWFSINDWSTTDSVAGGTVPFIPGNPTWTQYDGVFSSELHNFELTLRKDRGDWLTLLAGLRYLALDERLGATLTGGSPDTTAILDTRNDLFGFQIGTEAAIWNRGGALRIDGVLKAGIYHNDASSTATVNSALVGGTVTLSGPLKHTAFVGELGVVGTLQLTERLSAYAGYQLLFIEGVALATEQIPALKAGLVGGTFAPHVNGSPFYHGVGFGLTADF